MSEERLKKWKEKTKGIFHIIVYKEFWDFIDNLQQENKRLKEENKQLKIENSYYISKVLGGNNQVEKLIEIL